MLRRNLVITKVGKTNFIKRWLSGTERNFDLIVFAYDTDAMGIASEGVHYEYLSAPKVAGWNTIFTQNPHFLSRYDKIALLDDDLDMDTSLINRCFEMGTLYDLQLWQPSLSWNSHISFAGLLNNSAFELRYVNFIEMMCPFFTSDYLRQCLPLFGLGFETGPDLIWCSLSGTGTNRFAVIDSLVVHHTRPIGKMKKDTPPRPDDGYDDDNYACLKMFGMNWPRLVSDQAILRDGRRTKSQAYIAWQTLSLLRRFWHAPRGTRLWGFNLVLRHLRHQVMHKPYFADPKSVIQKLSLVRDDQPLSNLDTTTPLLPAT